MIGVSESSKNTFVVSITDDERYNLLSIAREYGNDLEDMLKHIIRDGIKDQFENL